MTAEEEIDGVTPEIHAIGISFGNSNSSIAYTSGVNPSTSLGFGHWLMNVIA